MANIAFQIDVFMCDESLILLKTTSLINSSTLSVNRHMDVVSLKYRQKLDLEKAIYKNKKVTS
jgi:hypothetical protein